MIKMIWAQELHGGIGYKNKLPWHLPKEMQFFKKTTLHHVVVMGYNTFLSLNDKPLVERTNVVLTSKQLHVDGFIFLSSVQEILNRFVNSHQDIYIIGGKKTYDSFLQYAQELIISKINAAYQCDCYMNIDLTNFMLIKTELNDDFSVEYYRRKKL